MDDIFSITNIISLNRIILRTIRNGNEHMKEGTLEIFSSAADPPDVIDYNFAFVETCVLVINFDYMAAQAPQSRIAYKVTHKFLLHTVTDSDTFPRWI